MQPLPSSSSLPKFLGIDYGKKRTGLAFGELGIAFPLPPCCTESIPQKIHTILSLIQQRSISHIVIGYPLNEDDSPSPKAKEIDSFIALLKQHTNLPISRVNEFLTSYQSTSDLDSLGIKPKRGSIKSIKKFRDSGLIDSRAATLILQEFLDNPHSAIP